MDTFCIRQRKLEIDALGYILSAAACAVSLFAATLFATRRVEPWLDRPLAFLFLANALTYVSDVTVAMGVSQDWESKLFALEAVAFYLILPSLWAYVNGLTAEGPIIFQRKHLRHLIMFGLASLMAVGLWILAPEARQRMIDGPLVQTPYELLVGVLMNIVFLSQPVLTIGYAAFITRKLVRYRARLKDLFASTERRELGWIGWVATVFAFDQASTYVSDFLEATEGAGFYGTPVSDLVDLVLFWALALWAARQMPGLRDEALLVAENAEVPAQSNGFESGAPMEKYGRSALTGEMRENLAARIERAMADEKLYLDPNLSLRKLASHLREHANYVSQVINTTLESTFFDYVNRWRINAALSRVKNDDETILKIAYEVGFNSRSSFYTAFKKETGKTPTEYRRE